MYIVKGRKYLWDRSAIKKTFVVARTMAKTYEKPVTLSIIKFQKKKEMKDENA
jgi:hypothetical protein